MMPPALPVPDPRSMQRRAGVSGWCALASVAIVASIAVLLAVMR